jgi:hypothetical protein
METLNEYQKRQLIGQFYEKNREKGKPFTVRHFIEMGLKKRSIYSIISRIENKVSLKRSIGSGRKAVKMNHKRIESLINSFDGKKGISQRKQALKYKISQPYVSKILGWAGVKYYKRGNKPKTSPEQDIKIKKRLNLLSKTKFRPSNGLKIVMDDESYFSLSGENMPGNDGYYSSNKSTTDIEVKYRTKAKFPAKILVWVAISENGRSNAYFAPKNCAIDSKTYSKECIIKRLIPFLRTHHEDGQYLFWPDLAPAHYSKNTIAVLKENNINFVNREDNPPNVPQLRPIERFWSLLKSKVYEKDWKAKNIDHLKTRIKQKLREISPKEIINLMKKVKTNVRKAADKGQNFMYN